MEASRHEIEGCERDVDDLIFTSEAYSVSDR